jgi:RHS repeat-associated protein
LTDDVENRLVEAQSLITASQYLYDPLGNRKQKQVQMGGGDVVTQFLAPGGEEIADYNCYSGTCTPWVLTVRGPGGLPVAAITPATGSQAETVVYYHHDVMGSTVASTVPGLSGAAEAYVYSDFGAPAGGSYLAYQFAGYRYDSETGLYYVHARYYNPTLGRFLQTDPIGFQGGNNLYAYVGNDPINLFDPTGLSVEETGNDSDGNSSDSESLGRTGSGSGSKTLNLGGVIVDVTYQYGAAPPYEAGVDITATPENCNSCMWAQTVTRTGDGAMAQSKDGQGVGPLYGEEAGPPNQFNDLPASGQGAVGTFTAVTLVGQANISAQSFAVQGAMTYGYSTNGTNGGITMIPPSVATSQQINSAIQVLRNSSPSWNIHR